MRDHLLNRSEPLEEHDINPKIEPLDEYNTNKYDETYSYQISFKYIKY